MEALEERFLLNNHFQLPPVVTNLATTRPQVFSTVPTNGDVNPYGIVEISKDFRGKGLLQSGDILVSNFNNAQNLQGTGTTIDLITPDGHISTFFQGPAGLDAALGILKVGFVVVGNVPTADGTSATVQAGSLSILDSNGKVVVTITDSKLLDGPWDLTINDQGNFAQIFVSNVLSGTITRIDLRIHDGKPEILDKVQIASGYAHRLDPAALVVGPAGLAYDQATDTLYVASSADNEIFAIRHAGTNFKDQGKGQLTYKDDAHLHGPLGLAFLPNGDLIVANSDAQNVDPNQPSELVEFTRTGKFVGQFSLDPNNGGAFNERVFTQNGQLKLAAVDDNINSLKIWTLPQNAYNSGTHHMRAWSYDNDANLVYWLNDGAHGHPMKGPAI
jgi:hypothetical protein